MVFVVMLKLSDGFKKGWICDTDDYFYVCKFLFTILALKTIPIGTGYAIWTGIGAVGSVTLGMIVFKERKSVGKLLFITMIIAGVVGLKLTSGV